MKLSQNNWEKKLRKKFQNAESKPEGHVWELIELELDSQNASTKRKTYKSAAAAAVLLLLASAFLVTMPNQKANLANFNFDLPSFNESNLYTSVENSENIISSEIKFDEAQVTNQKTKNIKSVKKQKSGDLNTFIQIYQTAQIAPINKGIVERKTIQLDEDKITALNITSIPSIENYKASEVYDPLDEFTTSNIAWNNTPLKSKNNLPQQQLMITPSKRSLVAYQQVSNLEQNVQAITARSSLMDDSFMNLKGEMKVQAMDINKLLEESNEMIPVVSEQANWLADVDQELKEWQNVISEESKIAIPKDIDDDIVEELIEEAELDKEDPLTLLQEEANNLYYAKNINKGFHVGILTGFQNKWLTKNSRNPEISRDNAKRLFSPGYQVGLNVGYDFAKHFGIMTELKFSNDKIRFNNTDKDRMEHLSLKSIDIPIYFKAKHSMETAKMNPIVFNYLLGVNYSDLRSIGSYVDGEEKRFGQDYNTSEWGITAGFDFDYYFSNNLFLTVGARGSVNGFAKNFPRLDNATKTGTMSYTIGVYTRFNFRLPGR